jgi:CheY-like chemotaxis protein
LNFPQTDGDELTKRLREPPHLRNVAAPVLASYATDVERVRHGFDAHIPKPVNQATLTERIEQLKRLKPARVCSS